MLKSINIAEFEPNPELRKALQEAIDKYFHLKSIRGITIGFKEKKNKLTKQVAICFFVKKKHEKSKIRKNHIIPNKINNIPTDVIEADFKSFTRPSNQREVRGRFHQTIRPGISISRRNGGRGTFGLLVFRNNQPCILSNWHVLSGDRTLRPRGVYQPGGRNFDSSQFLVGVLIDQIIDIDGDAAIARIFRQRPSNKPNMIVRNLSPLQAGSNVLITSAMIPRRGQRLILEKSGYSTGMTRSKVTHIGPIRTEFQEMVGFITIPVAGNPGGIKNPDFEEISEPGDSGSVWYDPNTNAGVGLLCGGDSRNSPHELEHSVSNFLPRILNKFGVTLRPIRRNVLDGTETLSEGEMPFNRTSHNISEWINTNGAQLKDLRELVLKDEELLDELRLSGDVKVLETEDSQFFLKIDEDDFDIENPKIDIRIK